MQLIVEQPAEVCDGLSGARLVTALAAGLQRMATHERLTGFHVTKLSWASGIMLAVKHAA